MLELDDTATTGPGERGEIKMAAQGDMGNADDRVAVPPAGDSRVSYIELVLLVGAIIVLLAILAHILLQPAPVQYIY